MENSARYEKLVSIMMDAAPLILAERSIGIGILKQNTDKSLLLFSFVGYRLKLFDAIF